MTKYVTKKLSELNPASYNPREISERALDGLKASIKRFGLVDPIVWNEQTGNVVGGHQRLKVLQASGAKKTDVVVVNLSESEEKALNVTLNNPAITGVFTESIDDILGTIKTDLPEVYDDLLLDDLEDSKNSKIVKENIRPFEMTHILLSFPPNVLSKIQTLIDKLKSIPEVEIEQGSN